MHNISGLKRWSEYDRYKAYQRAYLAKQEELMLKYGATMNDSMMPQKKFIDVYTAIKNERIAQGRKPGNIQRDIINEQAFEYSSKKAKVLAKKVSEIFNKSGETHERIRPIDIRVGNYAWVLDEIWDDIKVRRNELKEQGYSPNDIKKIISQEYFGSPE